MKTFIFAAVVLLILAAVGTAFDAAPVKMLMGDQLSQIDGGGCGSCRKSTACGSATCVNKQNCSKSSSAFFCVESDDDEDDCSSDGAIMPCGNIQNCQDDTCSTCSPTTSACNKTVSNNGDSCD
jgi:hypothetical protein